MKVSRQNSAQDAIKAYVNQGQAAKKTEAPKKAEAASSARHQDKVEHAAHKVVSDVTTNVLDKPVHMRYGVLPPAPDPDHGGGMVMRYGVLPPAPQPNPHPVNVRYGIFPPHPLPDVLAPTEIKQGTAILKKALEAHFEKQGAVKLVGHPEFTRTPVPGVIQVSGKVDINALWGGDEKRTFTGLINLDQGKLHELKTKVFQES